MILREKSTRVLFTVVETIVMILIQHYSTILQKCIFRLNKYSQSGVIEKLLLFLKTLNRTSPNILYAFSQVHKAIRQSATFTGNEKIFMNNLKAGTVIGQLTIYTMSEQYEISSYTFIDASWSSADIKFDFPLLVSVHTPYTGMSTTSLRPKFIRSNSSVTVVPYSAGASSLYFFRVLSSLYNSLNVPTSAGSRLQLEY
nr:14893_t:CDS:2 [Entrophospora candida]